MARSIWKGSIAFGLVHIPVGLYAAQETEELHFTMLDRRDFSPIGYERVNKGTGKKVEWKDVVRGHEHEKGEYVVLTNDDIADANPEATHTIDLVSFVEASEIDPMYFDKPYYLAPAKTGQKAYALLLDTLEKTDKVGIGKIVIRTRQHLAALVPRDGMLVLIVLRYAHELRDAKDLDLVPEKKAKTSITDREREMAKKLVEGMVEPWKPEQYKDEFRDDVVALIEKKIEAGEVNTVAEPEPKKRAKKPASVVDLMTLLKQSLDDKGNEKPRKAAAKTSKSKPTKKAAPKRHLRRVA